MPLNINSVDYSCNEARKISFIWFFNTVSFPTYRDRITKTTATQKQSSRGVLSKRYSENMQQIYWRTPMPKCGFEIALRHGCSPVNLLHIFRTPFLKNTSGRLLLATAIYHIIPDAILENKMQSDIKQI